MVNAICSAIELVKQSAGRDGSQSDGDPEHLPLSNDCSEDGRLGPFFDRNTNGRNGPVIRKRPVSTGGMADVQTPLVWPAHLTHLTPSLFMTSTDSPNFLTYRRRCVLLIPGSCTFK
jgi:hypothetical protein